MSGYNPFFVNSATGGTSGNRTAGRLCRKWKMKNMTITEKIITAHLIEGKYEPGREIGIRIDHTLTQDATGTLVYLQFEKLGLNRVKTEVSVSYVDHNLLQTDFKNADDHLFLQSAAQRYGLYFSRPGNGISHQVHLESFGVPGKTLLGSDSHTPTGGGLGMLAIGAGGLDVALAMAGMPFYLSSPKVLGVKLTGSLQPWVSGKDIILEMLRRLTVKGGVGKVIEYYGPGVSTLSVTDRAAIANMGAELGATSTVFPSDGRTREFLASMGRESQWAPLAADDGAVYDDNIEIDLSTLEPLIAQPGSPDAVVPVREIEGMRVHQVLIGSCANSSYRDLMAVASIMNGRRAHDNVAFEVNPGSRIMMQNLVESGGAAMLYKSGARVHQSGCMGCIGMGQAPATDAVSLRTFPRNFPGRSGTKGDKVFLCSPETAAAAAAFGVITDPRKLGKYPSYEIPAVFSIDKSGIIEPLPIEQAREIQLCKGPNIVTLPDIEPMPETIRGRVLIKTGDNVTTDDIMPAGASILPLRSNIPAISRHVFERLDEDFYAAAIAEPDGGIVIGGLNYGQGSSREHAALAPRFLNIRAKFARSFARIHRSNLINFGILPLTFADDSGYDAFAKGDRVVIEGVREAVAAGNETIEASIGGRSVTLRMTLSDEERKVLLAGGRLNYVKSLS